MRYPFGRAIERLRAGIRVQSDGIPGAWFWLIPGTISRPIDLPRSAHVAMLAKVDNIDHPDELVQHERIDMRAPDGSIVVGWTPTTADLFRVDWSDCQLVLGDGPAAFDERATQPDGQANESR